MPLMNQAGCSFEVTCETNTSNLKDTQCSDVRVTTRGEPEPVADLAPAQALAMQARSSHPTNLVDVDGRALHGICVCPLRHVPRVSPPIIIGEAA
jgi:hypothetical protein